MSVAELTDLKKEVKKYLDLADERVVRMIYAMLETDANNTRSTFSLSPEQEAILDLRMEKYKNGQMKFSTFEEVENRIITRSKNEL